MSAKKYVYPALPARYLTPFFRLGGNGLANCMFVVARAMLRARDIGAEIIEPTWFNIGIGPYLRGERDKRHYLGIFERISGNSGMRKLLLLALKRKDIERVEGLSGYFQPILNDSRFVRDSFWKITAKKHKRAVDEENFSDTIAVHIRLGDYSSERRTSLSWYKECITHISSARKKPLRFVVFSDGTDEELTEILKIPHVVRSKFSNAIEDIWAISRCKGLIASDSTFSGWGAYLGQVPSLFQKKHYGRVLENSTNEMVIPEANKDVISVFCRNLNL